MFNVALLLREGQHSDDDVLTLIRGAVTTLGGRTHTLPIIAQYPMSYLWMDFKPKTAQLLEQSLSLIHI